MHCIGDIILPRDRDNIWPSPVGKWTPYLSPVPGDIRLELSAGEHGVAGQIFIWEPMSRTPDDTRVPCRRLVYAAPSCGVDGLFETPLYRIVKLVDIWGGDAAPRYVRMIDGNWK